MKLFEKYTFEHYASIMEIRNDFTIGSSLIIEELERFRDQFRMYFIYQNKRYSIVMTKNIKEKMNQIYSYESHEYLHPLIQLFILRNDSSACEKCIVKYSLPIELLESFDYIYSFEEDITKSFLEWLEHILTLSFMKVINYECKIQQLPIAQRIFCQTLNHEYFDIETYMKQVNVSYETARHHLNQLTQKNYIIRHKIGKKYVYSKGEI